MNEDKFKIALCSVLTLIGTYYISISNVRFPMVENDGSIIIHFLTFILLFGFLFSCVNLGNMIYKYTEINGDQKDE